MIACTWQDTSIQSHPSTETLQVFFTSFDSLRYDKWTFASTFLLKWVKILSLFMSVRTTLLLLHVSSEHAITVATAARPTIPSPLPNSSIPPFFELTSCIVPISSQEQALQHKQRPS